MIFACFHILCNLAEINLCTLWFFVHSLGFSIYKIVPSPNKDNFIFSFMIYIPFFLFYFFCLISSSTTLLTMLNENCESGHLCIFNDLRRKTFSFSPLCIILDVFFLHIVLIKMKKFPSSPIFMGLFIMNRYWILSNAFSASIDMIMWFLSLGF